MRKPKHCQIDYGTVLREPETIRVAARRVLWLREHHALDKIDVIVTRGSSGLLVGSRVAELSKGAIKHIHARKQGENSHGRPLEGATHELREMRNGVWISLPYLIVDDFVSSGATVREIVGAVAKHANPAAVCAGVLCYSNHIDDRAIESVRVAPMKVTRDSTDTYAPVYNYVED